jgi:4-amino-4-deoxy-L-arabinose transferase-like glycosyltransferase
MYFRIQMGIHRYIDADEFAHLHWAYSFFSGERPYKDFFYLFPPFFLFALSKVIFLFGRSFDTVVAARAFMFLVSVFTAAGLFMLGRQLQGRVTALLAVFFFLILPLPTDKMIEIRPDLISFAFALWGIYAYVRGIEKNNKIWLVVSGFCYGLALGFVPKVAFMLIPLILLYLFKLYRTVTGKQSIVKTLSSLLPFVSGFAIPSVVILVFLVWTGAPMLGLYSMTKLASDLTAILGRKFYMLPSHFFYPNDTFYGIWGYSPAYIVNLGLWGVGIGWGILRLMGSLSHKSRVRTVQEFLMAGSFFAMLYSYVWIYPLKHVQYLIPISIFVVWYSADFVRFIISRLIRVPMKWFQCLVGLGVIFSIVFLTSVGIDLYQRKTVWNSDPSKQKLNRVLSEVPGGTALFDLTGETVFYPDGFYFCCLPYGQYQEGLTFDLPDISTEFTRRNTQAVHIPQGWLDKIIVDHKNYLITNFEPSKQDPEIWVRKKQ